MAKIVPISVVETPEFLSAVEKLMSPDERALLVDFLAYNPLSGDLMQGTGGLRKLRWRLEGRGKRGGARVIYFYYDADNAAVCLDRLRQERSSGFEPARSSCFPAVDGQNRRDLQEDEAMSKVAESILRGLEQAADFAAGAADVDSYRIHVPREIDVRAIRARLAMTQQEFAARFGFSVNTLRHWEQGSRQPEGPTRAYLLVIDRAPQAVQKALQSA